MVKVFLFFGYAARVSFLPSAEKKGKLKKQKTKPEFCLSCAHLPALDVGLQLFQSLQFLHLPLGLVDVGADSLHGLQSLLHCRVVSVLLWSPFQQFLGK